MRCSWPIFMGGREDCGYDHSCHGRGRHGRDRAGGPGRLSVPQRYGQDRECAAELCGGGLLLGAFFMATDYVTSPITPKGQIVFGILLGILTGIFRVYGASAEGVSYAIIISNLMVPLIEKVTIPVPFGKEGIKDGK